MKVKKIVACSLLLSIVSAFNCLAVNFKQLQGKFSNYLSACRKSSVDPNKGEKAISAVEISLTNKNKVASSYFLDYGIIAQGHRMLLNRGIMNCRVVASCVWQDLNEAGVENYMLNVIGEDFSNEDNHVINVFHTKTGGWKVIDVFKDASSGKSEVTFYPFEQYVKSTGLGGTGKLTPILGGYEVLRNQPSEYGTSVDLGDFIKQHHIDCRYRFPQYCRFFVSPEGQSSMSCMPREFVDGLLKTVGCSSLDEWAAQQGLTTFELLKRIAAMANGANSGENT